MRLSLRTKRALFVSGILERSAAVPDENNNHEATQKADVRALIDPAMMTSRIFGTIPMKGEEVEGFEARSMTTLYAREK